MATERYVLKDPEARLRMPDRGYRFFKPDGEAIDPANPYYALAIRQGDLVPEDKKAADAPAKSPVKAAPEGDKK